MRIDGFQNIPALLQSFRADENTKSNSGNGAENPSSSVSLSSFGKSFNPFKDNQLNPSKPAPLMSTNWRKKISRAIFRWMSGNWPRSWWIRRSLTSKDKHERIDPRAHRMPEAGNGALP